MQRGNCTFKEKILKAAAYNATAVLIYNNSPEYTVKMGHEGQSARRTSQSETSGSHTQAYYSSEQVKRLPEC